MARIIVVGASGAIGSAVVDLLAPRHEVVRAGRRQGDHLVDLSAKASIEKLFREIGAFDAVVSAAGASAFGKTGEASDDDFKIGLENKLMGQVNLVRLALGRIASGGVITLTTGLLAREPWPGTAPTALVNAALEGFVRAAALDVSPDIRLNAVSPILVTETARNMGMDSAGTMSAAETAKAYRVSVEGDMTGQVLDVRDFGRMEA